MVCKIHGKNCNNECKDPNIDNGMMTKVWGPPGWLFLHCVTFGYPYVINDKNKAHETKKEDYKNFFYYLGKVMPCKYCRDSYMEFIQEQPIEDHLNSRDDLTKWFYKIHNKVNNKLGVPKCQIPAYKEMAKVYESYRAKCKKTTTEERENNLAKGCVTPANGTPRKCFLKVVQCEKADVTRRENGLPNKKENEKYILIEKKYIVYSFLVLFFIILMIKISML